MLKRTFLAAAAVAAFSFTAVPTVCAAPAYPNKDVKIIIPFAPGGATDLVFRVISEEAEKHLGKPIVPVNMGGAGGSKGSSYVKNSRADGYTLLGGHEFLMTTKYGGLVPFGLEAFEPVCNLAATPMTITSGVHVPYKTYQEFIDYAKKNPGKVVVTMSPASVGYVLWNEAAKAAGMDIDKDFRTVIINGVGPQGKAVMGGHADVYGGDVPSDNEFVKDGRVRFLAVSHPNRLDSIPDVPTMKELGYNVNVAVTRGVFVPKGTPKEVIEKIADAYKKACENPAIKKKIEDLGSIMMYQGPKETGEYFANMDKIYKENLAKK